jgi:hypothetical protein
LTKENPLQALRLRGILICNNIYLIQYYFPAFFAATKAANSPPVM